MRKTMSDNHQIFSCDTLVALGSCTKSGNVIFAKNSDRPLFEAQPLVEYPAADHEEGEMVQCTYISIPQVKHTYKVLGSKPHWIWGFEHGMNEHNVVIGNEAVWSVEPEDREAGLLGMDLLRLGLERGKTAEEAKDIIISLLETYGQGGSAAEHFDFRYHNAFLIADPSEAWIVDTVNRRYVARRVKDTAGISNCYSTGEEWDEASPDVKEHAWEMGYADPADPEPFHFARVYGLMGAKHRAAYPRFRRLNQLLGANKGKIDVETMESILRDHYEGELIEPRYSPADGLMVSICMHNMDEASSVTAAGVVLELPKEGAPTWRGCMSRPCCSVFLPYSIEEPLPENVSYAKGFFEDSSLWWKMERLTYEIEIDYPRNIKVWEPVQKELQQEMNGIFSPDRETMEKCAEKLEAAADEAYEKLKALNVCSSQPQRKQIVEAMKEKAKI